MRRTKEDAEQTRDNLLKSAVQIFSEKGVARTTLEEIAKGAGVTRGAIYWHFDSKTQIFEALHESMHRPFLDAISEGLEKDHPEPIEQLRNLWIKLFLDLEHDEQRKQALILFMRKCNYSGDLAPYKEQHRKKQEESMQVFHDYFEKMKKAGKLSAETNSRLLMEGMFCFMKGLLIEYLDEPDGFEIKTRGSELIELFFKNIGLAHTAEK